MLSDTQLADLRERLMAADYTLDAVLDRIGEAGRRGLERNSTVPAREALTAGLGHGASDPQATLARLWILQDAVPDADLQAALGDGRHALADAGLLAPEPTGAIQDGPPTGPAPGHQRWRSTAVIRPYGAQATDETLEVAGWICHDPLPNLDTRSHPPRSDFVLGISPASTTLAQLTIRTPVRRALDLGTGCGVQALHLAGHVAEIVATDLNPRALELARVTFGLSGVAADLRLGSLYEPVAGETFDLIVSNPPFVMSPPGDEARLTYREGDLPGDDLVRRVVVDGAARLAPGGTMQVLCNWAILRDVAWEERLAGWLRGTGCDALVLQRERLDPYEYVEIWLSDAGLDGSPEYDSRYRGWLAYLETLGVVGIGMGWISVRNAGRAVPDLRLEDWPFSVHQPLGQALADQHRAVDLGGRDDERLLATRWRLHPGVVQETLGRPGAEDPEHLVLRQSYGLGRALDAGTALAAFVGASDGELTASEIIGAIALLSEVDAGALERELVPRIRELVADAYLTD